MSRRNNQLLQLLSLQKVTCVAIVLLIKITAIQACPLEIWIYESLDACKADLESAERHPLVRGSIIADGKCRSTNLLGKDNTANITQLDATNLLPGTYSAICQTGNDPTATPFGQVTFWSSGCTTSTDPACGLEGATCNRQFSVPSWLYSFEPPPGIYNGVNLKCFQVNGSVSTGNNFQINFFILGDCNCATNEPTQQTTVPPTSRPTKRPTRHPTGLPTAIPTTSSPSSPPTTQQPSTRGPTTTFMPSFVPSTESPSSIVPSTTNNTQQPTVGNPPTTITTFIPSFAPYTEAPSTMIPSTNNSTHQPTVGNPSTTTTTFVPSFVPSTEAPSTMIPSTTNNTEQPTGGNPPTTTTTFIPSFAPTTEAPSPTNNTQQPTVGKPPTATTLSPTNDKPSTFSNTTTLAPANSNDTRNTMAGTLAGTVSGLLMAVVVGPLVYYNFFLRRQRQKREHLDNDKVAVTQFGPHPIKTESPEGQSTPAKNDAANISVDVESNDDNWQDRSAGSRVVSHSMHRLLLSPVSGKEVQLTNMGDDVSTLGEPVGLSSRASQYDESTASVQLTYIQHEAASNPSQAHFERDNEASSRRHGDAIPFMLPPMSLKDDDEASFERQLQEGYYDPSSPSQSLEQQRQLSALGAQQRHQAGTTIFPVMSPENTPRDLVDETTTKNSSMNSSPLDGLKYLNGSTALNSSSNNSASQQRKEEFQVEVPPGPLGLLMERSTIRAIDPDCVFATHVQVGDVLVSIDGNRVQHLSQSALAAVVQETANEPRRNFTFVRATVGCKRGSTWV